VWGGEIVDKKHVARKLVGLAKQLTGGDFQKDAVGRPLTESLKELNKALKSADQYGFSYAYEDLLKIKDALIKLRKDFI